MLWFVIILGQVMTFALIGMAMLIRHHHFIVAAEAVSGGEEAEEEESQFPTMVEQMMMAGDKDAAVQELVFGQRARLLNAGVEPEMADQMMFFLYQRLWS